MTNILTGIVNGVAAGFLLLAGQPVVCAQSLAPDIVVTRTINAPVAEVWKGWTSTEGIESFFAPKAVKVEPVAGGYGDGDDWAKNKGYFEKAWPNVMSSLEKRFAPK